jgi:glycosyltransferase involved in cell wall biosynthesis
MANGTVVPEVRVSDRHGAEPVIGSIGRFVKQKDFELFVDVIAALRKRGYGVRGCLVGDGPEMTKVRARVSEHGLEGVIEFPGMVTDTDKWFRYFDLYAITSSEEGLPVSLLEAMSYGLPVVAADVGAISSAIRSDEEGLTVPAGDKDCFVNAIAGLLDDSEQAARMGQRSRDRIVEEFSIEAISARYESAYLTILDQKTG